MAERGEAREVASCILEAHPNGGGLRRLLVSQGYKLHEASYGSEIGDKTDTFDWLPKFRDSMDRIKRTAFNDESHPEGTQNDIVIFKSCYPNNRFTGRGEAPGNPEGPELTVWNARAALTRLLEQFKKHPATLFVYVTAPPISGGLASEPAWKWAAKAVLGKTPASVKFSEEAELAREFNNWVISPDGWLRDYPLRNAAVFNYYDILTGEGKSNLSVHASGKEDSHPTHEGNAQAAAEFIPFLNRVVSRWQSEE